MNKGMAEQPEVNLFEICVSSSNDELDEWDNDSDLEDSMDKNVLQQYKQNPT